MTCWREHASFGVWSSQMDFLEWAYVEALVAAGGWPVLVPPAPRVAPGLVGRFGGLLLAGGGDLAPERYGQQRHPATERVVPDRDEVEITLGRAALERDVPVLGVCRGHQVLAVLSGGSLRQDLPGAARALHAPAETMFGDHEVDVDPRSGLAAILGDRLPVKSHHHQAVDALGPGWAAVARGPHDTVEAIERAAARFAVGVQWHPEWSDDPRLFEALVGHARAASTRQEAARANADGTPGAVAPVIGITTYRETIRVGRWEVPAAVLPNSYAQAVIRAGAQPLLLPPVVGAAESVLEVVDAIVLTGGGDIDPARYGGGDAEALLGVDGGRDEAELELIGGALRRDMPLLGICRGQQLLNVAAGGDLIRHVPDVVGHDGHKRKPGVFSDHPVELTSGSRLGGLLGRRVTARCHHHQAIGRVAASLAVVGRARDGTIEAVEVRDARFAVGVQWHPEEDGHHPALFDELARQAGVFRRGRCPSM